jgi:DNA-binding response OmpR family regulator
MFKKHNYEHVPFSMDDWSVDEEEFLHGPGGIAYLARCETALLRILAEEPNRPRPGTAIMRRMETSSGAVHVHVCRLRKKLRSVGSGQQIDTLNGGKSYRLSSTATALSIKLELSHGQMNAIQEAMKMAERQVPGITARAGLVPA